MERWYRFWKEVRGHISSEKYVFQNSKYVKEACETWADREPGGIYSMYRYGFQEVSSPPKDKLEKMIEQEKEMIKYKKQKLKFLEETLKKIKDKKVKKILPKQPLMGDFD